MNNFNGIGRLTGDAALTYTNAGIAITKFSICIHKVWKDKDNNRQEKPHFFNCVLWGKYGEAMSKYLTKGKQIGITAELEQTTWVGNDGKNHSAVQLNVSELYLLASPREKGGNSADETPPPKGNGGGPPEDVPF